MDAGVKHRPIDDTHAYTLYNLVIEMPRLYSDGVYLLSIRIGKW